MKIRDVSPLRNRETLLGVILIVFAGVFLMGVSNFPDTAARYRSIAPSFFPNLLGVALAILGGLLLLEGIRSKPAIILEIEASHGNVLRAAGLLALLVAYIALFRLLGFALMSGLFVLGLQLLLGAKNVVKAAILAVAVTAALYIVFVTLLRVPLPHGILFG